MARGRRSGGLCFRAQVFDAARVNLGHALANLPPFCQAHLGGISL
jgi:hypothetical protein